MTRTLSLRAGLALAHALLLSALIGADGAAQSRTFETLGNLRRSTPAPGGVLLRAEHGAVLVQSIAGVGLRVRVRFGDAVPDAFPAMHSVATGDSMPRVGSARVDEAGSAITVTAEGMTLTASRSPLRLSVRDAQGRVLLAETLGASTWQGRVAHVVRGDSSARYFGLGEQPVGLDRWGAAFPFWNTDQGVQIGRTPIYSSFPFYIKVKDGAASGLLYDNPFKGEMDFGARLKESVSYTAEGAIDGGELRFFVVNGPGLDSLLARYSRLVGRTPMPPRWALGYHQSRYSYHPDSQVLNLAAEFRRRHIPADVIHFDIHFMRGYRVFTWSPEEFPRPKHLLDTLRVQGFRVVTIVDPGVKTDSAYSVYREGLARHAFVTMPDGTPYVGVVWPGRSAFPDFSRRDTRTWWGDQHRALVDSGVAGIWNDMNEPASFGAQTISDLARFDNDGRPGTHLEFHNQYGTLEARATYEGLRRLKPNNRPFIVTRAGYTGVQRYASMWTGDTYSTWDQLKVSLPMVISLGLSGLPFAGDDVGGFNGAPSADMFSRWLQSATLLPFFRTHHSIDSPRREPWSYGAEHERANRATISLRYRMLPTLYTAFYQHTRDGSPVVRPVFWSALADTAALGSQFSYMLGDHLLVAPVVDSAKDSRAVYLPAGTWYRLGSDERLVGGATVTAAAPRVESDGGDTTALRGLPVFARAGAVVAMQALLEHTDQRVLDTLQLRVFPGAARSELYEDAGDGYAYQSGQYRLTTFVTSDGDRALDLRATTRGAYRGASTFDVTIASQRARPARVLVDGREMQGAYDAASHTVRLTVPATFGHVELVH
jgi:alpha-glucosidase